jgi:hypothetical protein
VKAVAKATKQKTDQQRPTESFALGIDAVTQEAKATEEATVTSVNALVEVN